VLLLLVRAGEHDVSDDVQGAGETLPEGAAAEAAASAEQQRWIGDGESLATVHVRMLRRHHGRRAGVPAVQRGRGGRGGASAAERGGERLGHGGAGERDVGEILRIWVLEKPLSEE